MVGGGSELNFGRGASGAVSEWEVRRVGVLWGAGWRGGGEGVSVGWEGWPVHREGFQRPDGRKGVEGVETTVVLPSAI